jgi:phosphopantetheinyl transferase (holo-ACP synthase)
MIYGIGTDIVNISRIKNMKSLQLFSEKILSVNELQVSSSYD